MSIKSEGGRAFPSNYVEQEGPNKGMQMVAGGMTRRQWLAGMALTSFQPNIKVDVSARNVLAGENMQVKELKALEDRISKMIAKAAYEIADAMLALEASEGHK